MKTLYSILGVDPGVSFDDLEQAYLRRKVAYPQTKLDADENARIQWQGIEQAYRTLANPDSRMMYDRRLANAGVKTAPVQSIPEEGHGWLSTRNIMVAGLIVIIISGMWFYQAREKARMQKEILEQALRIAEEEKKKQAELRAAEEERRQASFVAQQRREQENREQAFQRETQQIGQQVSRENQYQSSQAQAAAQSAARQEQYQRDQRERAEQAAKRQAQHDAERRLANEKAQLRSMCMQRYNRPDC